MSSHTRIAVTLCTVAAGACFTGPPADREPTVERLALTSSAEPGAAPAADKNAQFMAHFDALVAASPSFAAAMATSTSGEADGPLVAIAPATWEGAGRCQQDAPAPPKKAIAKTFVANEIAKPEPVPASFASQVTLRQRIQAGIAAADLGPAKVDPTLYDSPTVPGTSAAGLSFGPFTY